MLLLKSPRDKQTTLPLCVREVVTKKYRFPHWATEFTKLKCRQIQLASLQQGIHYARSTGYFCPPPFHLR